MSSRTPVCQMWSSAGITNDSTNVSRAKSDVNLKAL
jgi:hypothetical protein